MAIYIDMYSRLWGNKDIKRVTVTNLNNSLSFKMEDNTEYTIFIKEAVYAFDDIPRISGVVNNINEQLVAGSIPIKAYVGGVSGDLKYDCIVFSPQGTSRISEITGSFISLFNQ